jgi:hypothetical protein
MSDQVIEQTTTLNLKFQVSPSGIFEIIAISAGQANGSPSVCIFKPDVLKESLPLWNGVQCFVDHDGLRARSITQLAGACTNPQWDDLEQGVRLVFGAKRNQTGTSKAEFRVLHQVNPFSLRMFSVP